MLARLRARACGGIALLRAVRLGPGARDGAAGGGQVRPVRWVVEALIVAAGLVVAFYVATLVFAAMLGAFPG